MGDVPRPLTAPYFNTNKATENFARLCQLIMTICSDLFRDILSRYIKPADLRLELDKNRKKLERIMNAQQKEQLYPSSGATTLTAKDLDISIMYILLRNICNIPKHRNGWGNPPQVADTSLAACIELIRFQRNAISGHSSSGEMKDDVFQDHWDKLKNAIVEIEKQLIGGDMYKRGVDELLTCDLNPSRAEKYMMQLKSIQACVDNEGRRLDNVVKRIDIVQEQLSMSTTQLYVRLTSVEEQQLSTTKHLTDMIKFLEKRLPKDIQKNRYIKKSHKKFQQRYGDDDEENILNDLHSACLIADEEKCRYIIQTSPDLLNSVDNDGWNAALYAAKGGNIEILQLLVENEVEVKQKGNADLNVLHVACFSANLEMVLYIIEIYPELLHSVDTYGWNAALHAARGGNIDILQRLADNEVDVRREANDSSNILLVACSNSNVEMSGYIIQNYPDLLHRVDTDGWNAALHAARGGQITILQLLADTGVVNKHKDNVGCNILHVACQYSNLETGHYIIHTYPDLLHSVDNDGWNGALHAAKGGNIGILQLLAENEIEVKRKGNDNLNVLHVACFSANLEMVPYIIETYPELLHSVDTYGWNAALHASCGGNIDILQRLADNEVDVRREANDSLNILLVACSYSNVEMSGYIIQKYPDLLHRVDNDGWNAALYAAKGGNVGILQLLAENEVDVEREQNVGSNILHVACGFSNLEMSRYIMQAYPNLLHCVDNYGWNVAMHTANGGNVEILQTLAYKKIDVKHKDDGGRNILHVACVNCNLQMSRYIIETYPDLLHSVDNDGWNAAIYAARGGDAEILHILAENEVDVRHKNKNRRNILHVACVNSNTEMSRYIIQKYPDLLYSVDYDGMDAVLLTASVGNVMILGILAENGVNVKHKDSVGRNILHVACLHSQLQMSNYIIQTYPDLLHSVDDIGQNAAFFASIAGSVKVLQLLAGNGVDVKHENKYGVNILHMACLNSNLEMSCYIIQTYPDLLYSVDNDGWNAALHAAKGGNVEILQLLAENGVNVKHRNVDGDNAYIVACREDNSEMIFNINQTYPELLPSVDNERWNDSCFFCCLRRKR